MATCVDAMRQAAIREERRLRVQPLGDSWSRMFQSGVAPRESQNPP